MDCAAVLSKSRSSILDESFTVVDRSHLRHYETAGEELTRERLAMLFDLVVSAIDSRDLSGVTGYAESVARERFGQGYDIGDVQAAFNALEEAMSGGTSSRPSVPRTWERRPGCSARCSAPARTCWPGLTCPWPLGGTSDRLTSRRCSPVRRPVPRAS